jgi:hypothetical protein
MVMTIGPLEVLRRVAELIAAIGGVGVPEVADCDDGAEFRIPCA